MQYQFSHGVVAKPEFHILTLKEVISSTTDLAFFVFMNNPIDISLIQFKTISDNSTPVKVTTSIKNDYLYELLIEFSTGEIIEVWSTESDGISFILTNP